jgi:integrase
MHAAADPVASEIVRQVRLGMRRTYGTAPRRLARPLSTADIRQILDGIDRTDPVGVRDAAIILLGYASAMRRSELTALTLLDVEEKADGLLVTVRRSKPTRKDTGRPSPSPAAPTAHGSGRRPDRLAQVARSRPWTAVHPLLSQPDQPPTALRRRRRPDAPEARPRSGLHAERITAHSLRAGHATTAALGGAPLARIAAQTRHRDLSVLVNRYIRPLEALATTSRYLGL